MCGSSGFAVVTFFSFQIDCGTSPAGLLKEPERQTIFSKAHVPTEPPGHLSHNVFLAGTYSRLRHSNTHLSA